MDFLSAIDAHGDWKKRLRAYLLNPDHSLSAQKVSSDSECDLGKWIYSGETRAYVCDACFQKLKTVHAEFHEAAAEVVRRANTGEVMSEEDALGSSSAFGMASIAIIQCLIELSRRAA